MSVSLIDGHIDDDINRMTFEDVKRIRENPTAEDVDNKELHRLIDIALEKQIPKKPDYEGDGYDENGILIYDRAICPTCGNDDFEYDINNWGCKYCPDCGQALDWSDTE